MLSGTACQKDSQPLAPRPSFASSASLPHINNTSVPIPASISADFSAYDCSNNPGPQITFAGGTILGGFGVALTSGEIFIGRCVQGAGWHVTQSATMSASAFAEFTVESCANSPGPYISFTGSMTGAGLSAKIIFRNNDNPVGGPHEADVTRSVVMVPAGYSVTFPKQPVQGGVGGNPWIWAGFTDASGTALGDPTLLVRCEQLSKALS